MAKKTIPSQNWWDSDAIITSNRDTCNSETHTMAGYSIIQTNKTKGAEKQWAREKDGVTIETTWAKSRLTALSRMTPDYVGSLDAVLTLFPQHTGVFQIGLRTLPTSEIYKDVKPTYEAVVRIYDSNGTLWGESLRSNESMAVAALRAWWLWRMDGIAQQLTERLYAELI